VQQCYVCMFSLCCQWTWRDSLDALLLARISRPRISGGGRSTKEVTDNQKACDSSTSALSVNISKKIMIPLNEVNGAREGLVCGQ